MAYVILTPLANDDIDELAREYSAAFLTSEANVTAIRAREAFYLSKSLKSCTNQELFGKWAIFKFDHDVAVLDIGKEFKTDKKLIDYYGDRYLGLCSGKLKKVELLSCVEKVSALNLAQGRTHSAFSTGINLLHSLLTGCEIPHEKMSVLEAKDNKHKAEMTEHIDALLNNFKQSINTSFSFLQRDF